MHTNEVYYTNNINAGFSEHESILLIAQVTEYLSFLGWSVFNVIAISQCQNVIYVPLLTCHATLCQFDMCQNVHVSRSHVHTQAYETEW